MSTILFREAKASKRVSFILQPLYSSSFSVRYYASINSGINRGLRKSKGAGFRGKEKSRPSRENDGGDPGFQIPGLDSYSKPWQERRSVDHFGGGNKSMHSRFKENGRNDESKSKHKSFSFDGDRRDRETSWKGKPERSQRFEAKNLNEGESFDRYKEARTSKSGYERKPYGSRDEVSGYERKPYGLRDEASGYERKPYSSRGKASGYERKPYGSRDEASGYEKRSSGRTAGFAGKRLFDEKNSFNDSSESRDIRPSGRGYEGPRKSNKGWNYPSKYPTREERLEVKAFRAGLLAESRSSPRPEDRSEAPSEAASESFPEHSPPRVSTAFAKNIPVTIPYTTPASEFLYGTSVVEAVLNARRKRSRKLYKLYIHKGEDRQNGDRDGILARLATKRGVEVVTVQGFDWLRTLDKMSQGRPHNGYVLEASPLPRLPIISLGEVIDQDDSFAIKLTPDHQSREEIAVNGNDTIAKFPKDSTGRKPLILLLDSIEDPQNLGAILRTAVFMGVTAVAISTRNSASFTPVVFKASAGAAETIEIFSVNKPNGFVKDSQTAGWKIYAAVAPPPTISNSRYMWPTPSQEFVWAHDLQDPLREDPCILMIGGEGEGLRKSLKDHADVNISIKGAATRGKLDSLNVSVATGMLCDAFMRRASKKTVDEEVQKVEEETENLEENKIF